MNTDIGTRLRKMREAQNLDIEQLSKMTGIPLARLAAFESGEETPSIGMVIKVSRMLGSRMSNVLHEHGERPEIFSIVKAERCRVVDRPRNNEQGYTYQSLLRAGMVGQAMEPFLVTFDPVKGADVNPIAHEGEEFVQVIDGEVELIYNDEKHILEAGDTAYIDSSKPHAFRGIGETSSRMMAVIYSK